MAGYNRAPMQPPQPDAFTRAVQDLHALIARKDAARALMAESAIYNQFVKSVEDEAHYERAFTLWREPMAALGRAFGRPIDIPRPTPGPTRICFIFNAGTVLGHTEVLLRLLEKRDPERELASVCTLFGYSEEFVARFAAIGVSVHTYGGTPEGPHGWLRAGLAARGETTAVWVAAPPGALFMFAAHVAPVQVFWSLKHHPIRLPEIDGYLTYGSWGERERIFHGQAWTVCPVPLALAPRAAAAAAVTALRAKFPHQVLLGTLAREEKIASAPFLEAVAKILERLPQCGYLWTGRAPHPGIEAFFRSRGFAARCHFVGWVDTTLYAAVPDVFLETFPLGCGITGYQAMGAHVPLLSYLDRNTVFGMQYWNELMDKAGEATSVTREMLDAYSVLCARDGDDYVALATRLAQDEAFRDAWREREYRYYEEEIAGIGRYSRRFFDTVAAITAKKLAGEAAPASSPSPLGGEGRGERHA